jgi:hypothetical protein
MAQGTAPILDSTVRGHNEMTITHPPLIEPDVRICGLQPVPMNLAPSDPRLMQSNWPRKKRGLLFAISDALCTRTH